MACGSFSTRNLAHLAQLAWKGLGSQLTPSSLKADCLVIDAPDSALSTAGVTPGVSGAGLHGQGLRPQVPLTSSINTTRCVASLTITVLLIETSHFLYSPWLPVIPAPLRSATQNISFIIPAFPLSFLFLEHCFLLTHLLVSLSTLLAVASLRFPHLRVEFAE